MVNRAIPTDFSEAKVGKNFIFLLELCGVSTVCFIYLFQVQHYSTSGCDMKYFFRDLSKMKCQSLIEQQCTETNAF